MTTKSTDLSAFENMDGRQAYLEVAERIERMILDGTLPSETRLPGERELCAQLGVSRPVLREALHILRERGLTYVSQNRGSYVAPANFEAVQRSFKLFSHRAVASVRDVLELRRFIEVPTAALAASRRRPGDLSKLHRLISEMQANLPEVEARLSADPGIHGRVDSIERHIQLDIAFHLAVAEAAQNPLVLPVLQSAADLLKRYMYVDLRRSGGKVLALTFHQRIYAGIEGQDADTTQAVMAEHLESFPAEEAAAVDLI